MRSGSLSSTLVLAIHPSTTGFGWAVFEEPGKPVDWGVASARDDKNRESIGKLKKLIRRYQPGIILLEEFEGNGSRRALRIQKLCKTISLMARESGARPAVFERATIGFTLAKSSTSTRYEIAQAVAARFPELRRYLPPTRKPWMSEDPAMALFAAAALIVAHYGSADRHAK